MFVVLLYTIIQYLSNKIPKGTDFAKISNGGVLRVEKLLRD
jgi:hypothetical protein